MTDEDEMPFGKHQGLKLKEVPAKYLDWLSGEKWLEDKYPEIKKYIDKNRKLIDEELDQQGEYE